MKSLLLSATLFLALSLNVMAQSTDDLHRTEVYAGYGLLTAQDLLTGFSSTLAASLLPGYVERIDAKGFGAAYAGFDYFVGRRVSLGIQLNYAQYDESYKLTNNTSSTLKTSYLTPMVRSKLAWVRNPGFSVYSSVAVGATFIQSKNETSGSQTDKTTGLAFHISPLGIRVGNAVALFAEVGFGFQGLVTAGLSIRP
ncbi:hypothetical protein [Spirosoma sp. KNUC1025]|uniref:hypothetical protein n=1 Tax=Spirosoma sp. KNUC1025 TaxID=2894082 RepID=UPI003866E1A9|nr:hypothetical protein LN737_20620 [Spirosoma sp. KNUC1025]